MVAAGILLWAALQSSTELAEGLRSDRIEDRVAAARLLLARGEAARDLLEDLSLDDDPEVALRARDILENEFFRRAIDVRLLAALPGLHRKMIADPAWNDSLLMRFPAMAVTRHWDEGWAARAFPLACDMASEPDLVGRAELESLADLALAEPEEEILESEVLGCLSSLGIRPAEGRLREWLRVGSPKLREEALATLARLEGTLALPDLVPMLGDPEESVRFRACNYISFLGAGDAVFLVAGFLQGDSGPSSRLLALDLLKEAGEVEVLPTIRAQLTHADAEVRMKAAEAIIRLAPEKAASDLERLLQDPAEEVRGRALCGLWELEAASSLPAILRCLSDPSLRVRQQALEVTALLGNASVAESLLPHLSVPDLRVAALFALMRLDALRMLPVIRAYEEDPDPYVRDMVRQALALFGD